ncbi:hypothetical protein [Sphingomonas endolithica]|uniref:hypothetical protein n=1 Tax=Sphingomonas endolithica TaxID=2972485 RepID=UPI0021AFD5C9|nr:hypothetical protein [Sphingomonas sp. ZFBP2030]
MSEPPPFWIVFPSLGVADGATQGAEEAYLDLEWLPFWSGLDDVAKDSYLDRWNAPKEWREEIAERYDHPGFDVEEDSRDSAAWLARHRN